MQTLVATKYSLHFETHQEKISSLLINLRLRYDFLAFITNSFRVTGGGGLVVRNRSVWPTLSLLNVFTALKGTHFHIYIKKHLFCVFLQTYNIAAEIDIIASSDVIASSGGGNVQSILREQESCAVSQNRCSHWNIIYNAQILYNGLFQ